MRNHQALVPKDATPWHKATLIRVVLASALAVSSVPLTVIAAAPAFAAPTSSTSYYVTGYSTSWAYDRGCDLGTKDYNTSGTQKHIAILDFGSMSQNSSGTWMMSAFSGSSFSLASARDMVAEFGKAYFACTAGDLTSTVYIGLGTNNSAGTITSAAGAALANRAKEANATLQNGGYTQSFAIGANDFESWGKTSSNATASRSWIDGYNGLSGRPIFVNYGSAADAPRRPSQARPPATPAYQQKASGMSRGPVPRTPRRRSTRPPAPRPANGATCPCTPISTMEPSSSSRE